MNEQSNSMTWHQPGGSEKDPWRNPQSPPDLDQMIRKLWIKLLSFFSSNKGTRRIQPVNFTRFSLQLIVGILALLYLVMGVYIVEPAERAVITRFGKYVRTEGSGPHWVPRLIETVEFVNVERQESSTHGGLMLTQDENIVFVEVSIQYRVGNGEQDARDYLFQVARPVDSVRQATESALRQVIGHSNLDDVLTSGRAQIAEAIKKQVEETLAAYHTGIYVSDVVMQPAKAPDEVKNAFDDVIKAREEKVSFVNKAEAYANEIEAKAKGQSQRLIEDALACKQEQKLIAEGNAARFNLILPEYKQNQEITQIRLYLDTMESVLSRNHKVLVDTGNGDKNLIYLPIDQFLNQTQSTGSKNGQHSTVIKPLLSHDDSKNETANDEPKNETITGEESKDAYRSRYHKERSGS